ncbi:MULTISPECIES: VOC family protein [Sphingobium]|uniref:VOC family protein n=1 Tax=Sphingobium sp. MI1205 TaxID=407020 RepID=UPI00076FEC1F|nr:VOC family protein [Sphingobium sp. MI1205]AMK19599.1 biphenyl-2,3-diol 1,2-dioxygenase [Sphingobium sp. MI1205]
MQNLADQPVQNKSTSRIVPTRLAHFVIRSRNVSEVVEWYKTVFEADAVFDNGNLAFLYFDAEHHRIAVGEIPGLEDPNPNVSGIDHVAFSYRNIVDLLETYVRLKELGIVPYFKIDHGMTTSFYYKDPDGNQVELQVDNFETRDEAHAYFRSPAFAENPLGVEIDPDWLVTRLRAGEAPEKLLSSGTVGAREPNADGASA